MDKLLIILLTLLPTSYVLAGTTGKIVGRVTDGETGESLPFANVQILGTNMGGAANQNGYYFILNVPPGNYALKATMMGYRASVKIEVNVVMDMTAKVDFSLSSTVLEIAKEVVVVAERPLIRKDETSTMTTLGSREIQTMPVKDLSGVLMNQAGFNADIHDHIEKESQIHVRGGRVGEVAYMIDGMYVQDALVGGTGTMVNKEAIEELVVLTGAFNAEYGDAMSAVVNVVTKEGSQNYEGLIRYLSPNIAGEPYHKPQPYDANPLLGQDTLCYYHPKLPGWFRGELVGNLGGPFPFARRKMFFFLSGRYLNEDSWLPFGYNLEREIQGKINYSLVPGWKFAVTGGKTWRYFQDYFHEWKYYPQMNRRQRKVADRISLSSTYLIARNTFLNVRTSWLNQCWNKWSGTDPYEVPDAPKNVSFDSLRAWLRSWYEENKKDKTGEWVTSGHDNWWVDSKTITYTFNADIASQIHSQHEVKLGIEGKKHNISHIELIYPWRLSPYYDCYDRHPIEFATYIQDKMEFSQMTVNLGFRYDYANPKASMWSNWHNPDSPIVPAKPRSQFSPRLGMAFPITDKTVLHISYGHFFQNPPYREQYKNSDFKLITWTPIQGNPAVKAQKTVTYQAGLQHQLGKDMALQVTAWSKDVTDLLSTEFIPDYRFGEGGFTVYMSEDYATIRGIEFALKKRYSHFLSGSLSYTYSVAKGNRSRSHEGFEERKKPPVLHEYFLEFDRTHSILGNIAVAFPSDFTFRPLRRSQLNLMATVQSGLPYTPTLGGEPLDKNSGRLPWTYNLDLYLEKNFYYGGLNCGISVTVTNLLNRENVVVVFSETGEAFSEKPGSGHSYDYQHNLEHISAPRRVKLGVSVPW